MFYDFYKLGTFYFYVVGLFLAYDIITNKTIKLLHVWCFAFVFIILSEVFLVIRETDDVNLLSALKYLITANNVILIGYFSNSSLKIPDNKNDYYTYTSKSGGAFLLIFFVLIFFLFNLNSALVAFTLGRAAAAEGQDFVLSSIISSTGFILPSVILFYFYHLKKLPLYISIVTALPIFIILFMGGTRFPLLFSFLGFFITYQNLSPDKLSVRKIGIMISAVIILVSASFAMKDFRSISGDTSYPEEKEAYIDFPTYVSQYLSNEGVIDMTGLMMQHFTYNSHLYGTSSSFVTYFWVPRFIWEDKPTMLGHWFIRLYRGGFSDGHSSSFGFTGDLYADFGYGSLFFIFMIGRFLRKGEIFQAKALAAKNYKVILGAMLYPYVFFFVRSPITATITFFGILFFFFLFKKIIFSEQLLIKSK